MRYIVVNVGYSDEYSHAGGYMSSYRRYTEMGMRCVL